MADQPDVFISSRTDAKKTLPLPPWPTPRTEPKLVIRKRASKPKTRSGCGTCRACHVKCDETRPGCLRCTRLGRICDGYNKPKSKSPKQSSHQSRELLPIIRSSLDPSIILFGSEKEARYFRTFQTDMVPELSGGISYLWDTIVLQACHAEPFVREAVVALAALCWSLVVADNPKEKDPIGYQQHYVFALQQYDKALRNMQASLIQENTPLRSTLISCLLVFCFEAFQGNRGLALFHAQSGYKILQHWQKGNLAPESSAYSRTAWSCSTRPLLVENELVYAFYSLNLHFMTIFDSRPPKVHEEAKNYSPKLMELMPAIFKDMDDAMRWWHLVMGRCTHFIHYVSAIVDSEDGTPIRKGNISEQVIRLPNPDNDQLPAPGENSSFESDSKVYNYIQPGPLSRGFKEEYKAFTDETLHWQAAFKPFFDSVDEYRRSDAAVFQLQIINIKICLDAMITTEECAFDKFLPQFREMVHLAKITCSRPVVCKKLGRVVRHKKNIFRIDTGVLPALGAVVKMCRDHEVRREALNLLRSNNRKEGLWDSEVVAAFGQWIMELEEREAEGDFIPEHARVRLTKVDVDYKTRIARFECAKKGASGGLFFQETVIKLGH